ncbi:MFS transporter [Rahnella sp. PD12R]|nr:MFS transporter [Rahnella sp. PD12R]
MTQHQRVSHADADLQSEVTRFHRGENKPVVQHYLSVR